MGALGFLSGRQTLDSGRYSFVSHSMNSAGALGFTGIFLTAFSLMTVSVSSSSMSYENNLQRGNSSRDFYSSIAGLAS